MVKDNKNYVIEKVITTPDKIYDEASFMIKQVTDIFYLFTKIMD